MKKNFNILSQKELERWKLTSTLTRRRGVRKIVEIIPSSENNDWWIIVLRDGKEYRYPVTHEELRQINNELKNFLFPPTNREILQSEQPVILQFLYTLSTKKQVN